MKEKVYYTLNVKHYEGLNIKESANCLLKKQIIIVICFFFCYNHSILVHLYI